MIFQQPILRTPFTDLCSGLVAPVIKDECKPFQARAMYCAESYGAYLADEKCKFYFNDFYECITGYKRNFRAIAMRMERRRQYRAGELKEEYPFPQARPDSY